MLKIDCVAGCVEDRLRRGLCRRSVAPPGYLAQEKKDCSSKTIHRKCTPNRTEQLQVSDRVHSVNGWCVVGSCHELGPDFHSRLLLTRDRSWSPASEGSPCVVLLVKQNLTPEAALRKNTLLNTTPVLWIGEGSRRRSTRSTS